MAAERSRTETFPNLLINIVFLKSNYYYIFAITKFILLEYLQFLGLFSEHNYISGTLLMILCMGIIHFQRNVLRKVLLL
jgi:hypothetical protein